jgi:hypothetical protein
MCPKQRQSKDNQKKKNKHIYYIFICVCVCVWYYAKHMIWCDSHYSSSIYMTYFTNYWVTTIKGVTRYLKIDSAWQIIKNLLFIKFPYKKHSNEHGTPILMSHQTNQMFSATNKLLTWQSRAVMGEIFEHNGWRS